MTDLTHPDAAQFKARVSGSSFYTAMLLMPKAQRAAMFAIYMYCRLVDDIADDGTRPRDVRATELVQWRRDLDALPSVFLKAARAGLSNLL